MSVGTLTGRPQSADERPSVLEFFAGVGLARAGLESAGLKVIWANDYSDRKAALYRARFGAEDHYHLGDVFDVDGSAIPRADVAWASSPCTNLSLAGGRGGLRTGESNAFFGFTDAVAAMEVKPSILVLENVTGLATSHQGRDIDAVVEAFNRLGYACDMFFLDARSWLPQSRPRMFVIAVQAASADLLHTPDSPRPAALQRVFDNPNLETFKLDLPAVPEPASEGLTALIESNKARVEWWDGPRAAAFLKTLSPVQSERLEALRRQSKVSYRTAYRRTRNGKPVWEIRADDVAGCLRTARGGSSKQAIVKAGGGDVKIRWMTGKEYALLMGAGDYPLEDFRDSDIQFAFGDAVAVPLVKWLGEHVIVPSLEKVSEVNV